MEKKRLGTGKRVHLARKTFITIDNGLDYT